MVVTWWIVAFLSHDKYLRMNREQSKEGTNKLYYLLKPQQLTPEGVYGRQLDGIRL